MIALAAMDSAVDASKAVCGPSPGSAYRGAVLVKEQSRRHIPRREPKSTAGVFAIDEDAAEALQSPHLISGAFGEVTHMSQGVLPQMQGNLNACSACGIVVRRADGQDVENFFNETLV